MFSFYPSRPAEAEPQPRIRGKDQERSEEEREGFLKRAPIGCVNEQVGLSSAGPQGNCRADPGVGPLRSEGARVFILQLLSVCGRGLLGLAFRPSPHRAMGFVTADSPNDEIVGDIWEGVNTCPTSFTHACGAHILEMHTPLPRYPTPFLPPLPPPGGVCTGGHPLDPHPVLQQQNRL